MEDGTSARWIDGGGVVRLRFGENGGRAQMTGLP
jgi:hypothetical protein